MMPPTFRPHGQSKPAAAKAFETERGSASERGYGRAWQTASQAFLRNHPLCRYCDLEGFATAATLVDHFWPHRQDLALFWRREFWVASCAPCHCGMKQAVERAGRAALIELAGRLGIGSPG
jgi:5-methylcytosine-specific restriction protein A